MKSLLLAACQGCLVFYWCVVGYADWKIDPTSPYPPPTGEAVVIKDKGLLEPFVPPTGPLVYYAANANHWLYVLDQDAVTLLGQAVSTLFWQFDPLPEADPATTYCQVSWNGNPSSFFEEPEMTLRGYHHGDLIFENTFDASRSLSCEANLQLGAYGGQLFDCVTEFQLITSYAQFGVDTSIVIDRRQWSELDPQLDCTFSDIPQVPYIAD